MPYVYLYVEIYHINVNKPFYDAFCSRSFWYEYCSPFVHTVFNCLKTVVRIFFKKRFLDDNILC